MPDILLIQPPIRDFYITAKRTMPYGLASIAATLRRAGLSVEIFDGLATTKSRIVQWPREMDVLEPYYGRADRSPFGLFHHYRHFGYSLQHIANRAKASGARIIGISSLFTAYSDIALETAEVVKKACPATPVVLGGHHPTALPDAVMRHPAVDYVLRGDGEACFSAFARALLSSGPLDDIPGLVRRRSDGTLEISPPAVVNDLDALPPPAFDLVNWRHYQRRGRGNLALTASRGCPLRCTYCAVNSASYHGFRRRSIASVIAEIRTAMDSQSIGFIDFEDEHLCSNKQWVLEVLKGIRNLFGGRHPELRAMNGLFAPSLDEEVIRSMHRSGFKALNLALISTVASQLRRFARPDITTDVDRVLHLARQFALECVAYLIVAGPDQDPYDAMHDLVYLAQRHVLAGVSVFYPAPGSSDYEWCRKHRRLPGKSTLMRSTALPLDHVTDRDQAVTLMRLGRVLNFMKHLADCGESMPIPSKAHPVMDPEMDRIEVGKRLLAAFLHDGIIRGAAADGRVYAHAIDRPLARRFIAECRKITIKGASV